MSRSFTTKPSYTNTRGRGSSRGRGVTRHAGGMDQYHTPSPSNRGRGRGTSGRHTDQEEDVSGSEGASGEQGRIQRREAYTVITPDEKKRQKIAEGARKGEEAYQRHREQNRLGAVSYVGTVGGGEVSQPTARQKTVNQNKQAAFNVKMKSQQYREAEKQKENAQLDRMKDQQRQKSVDNKQREAERQQKLRTDHRAKNEAFLARFEQGVQNQKTQKVLSSSAATSQTEPSSTNTQSYDDCLSDSVSAVSLTSRDSHSSHPVDQLMQEFPGADVEFLETLLLQCNGNVQRVRDMINGT